MIPTNIQIEQERELVCRIARTWVGTPYHHMGRVKGAGADCAMFPLEVYRAAGLLDQIPVPYYPQDWALHRSDEIYLGIVQQLGRELEGADLPQPGDFALYHFGRCWSHGAIVLEWPLIIHSEIGIGVVMTDASNEGRLIGRKPRFFTPWIAGKV